jgi:hypothetical protein
MRWILVQASWSIRRWRPHDPIVQWSLVIERPRGKRIAVVGLRDEIRDTIQDWVKDESS